MLLCFGFLGLNTFQGMTNWWDPTHCFGFGNQWTSDKCVLHLVPKASNLLVISKKQQEFRSNLEHSLGF